LTTIEYCQCHSGRFQKVAGETEKKSYTSVGFSARRRLVIDKKFYFVNIESIELVGTLKWKSKTISPLSTLSCLQFRGDTAESRIS
jgi:hypothetical protein